MSLRSLVMIVLTIPILAIPLGALAQAGAVNGLPNQAVIDGCVPTAHGVINGISYTNCYTGSEFGVRVNAAMTDAENLSNGNTTGIVDSTSEPQSITQTTQITVGDGTHIVLWRLGVGMTDQVTLTGGTGYAVYQNPNTSIVCVGVQASGCTFSNYSANGGIYALYSTNGTGYYFMDGVFFKNQHGGTLASGNVGIVNGGYDGSVWKNSNFEDTIAGDSTVFTVTGVSFHSNFTNDTFDSEQGQTALSLKDHFTGINFHDITANTHGSSASGNPNILCTDAGPNASSSASFTGVTYMEGQTATMTAPFIQDNGCAELEFTGDLIAVPFGASTTSPIIDIANAETTLNVGNVYAYSGSGFWTDPATVVRQHNASSDCSSPPCNVAVTDSGGKSPGYHTRTSQFDNITLGGLIVSNSNAAEPLTFGPAVAVGSEQFIGLAAERSRFGYDGANTNTVVQGGATKGVGLLYNNNTFGSGYGALLDPSGNFGVGTNATNATSDAFYVTSTGAVVTTSTAAEVLTLGSGIAAQNQYVGVDNNRGYFGYDATNGNALHQGPLGKGVGLAVNNATFGSGYVFVCDNAGTNCGIGTNASSASSDPFYVTVATGAVHGASFSGPSVGSETVASSATPTFAITTRVSRNVLTANVTSFTLAAGADGQEKCLDFTQGSGPYTVAGPANVHGLFTVGTINAKENVQCFLYNTTATAWVAETPGILNQ